MTRRELLAAGSVALLELGAMPEPAGALASSADDGDLLRSALEVELLAVFAYRRTLGLRVLTPGAGRLVGLLLGHERAHARVLAGELRRLGVLPPPAPSSVSDADQELAARHASGSLAQVRTERDCIRLLLDVEALAEGAYYHALSALADPRLIRLAAQIMAAEAQHATVLSELLHPGDLGRAVPDAFVEGRH